jgi:hypothetical protein
MKYLFITAFLLQAQHAIVLGEMTKMMTPCLHLVLHTTIGSGRLASTAGKGREK